MASYQTQHVLLSPWLSPHFHLSYPSARNAALLPLTMREELKKTHNQTCSVTCILVCYLGQEIELFQPLGSPLCVCPSLPFAIGLTSNSLIAS